MKKLFITLATLTMTFSSFAQGTVNFATRSLAAKVFLSDGITGAGFSGISFTAQLAIVNANGSLTMLTPTATFGRTAITQWYVSGGLVAVTGFAPGTTATLRMVAYQTEFGSYCNAAANRGAYGFSNDITTGPLGGTTDVGISISTPNLVGLQSFVVGGSIETPPNPCVPEPTTYALLGLGGFALALRRRV